MFDRIAVHYDKVNWFISLGQVRVAWWRLLCFGEPRRAVRAAGRGRVVWQTTLWRLLALTWLHHLLKPRAKVLDVGCGTGWVSWYFTWRYRALNLNVEGMDCSHAMVRIPR
jgi:ubiquinone/menaquinone biosynthesis C-methylase UbiE